MIADTVKVTSTAEASRLRRNANTRGARCFDEKEALKAADAEKEEIAKSKKQSCCHGCVPTKEDVSIALRFFLTFVTALDSVEQQVDIWRLFAVAREATKVEYSTPKCGKTLLN